MRGIRVLDFTTGIAGGYCTKLLADAGADVVKVEPPDGDPIRALWSGGLFEYLHQSKRSVTDSAGLLDSADVAVTGDPIQAREWHRSNPSLVVVSISPFGAGGPWAGRPVTELTLQAACGSVGSRGLPGEAPLPVGGAIGEWITGTYAGLATVAAVGFGQERCGSWVDVAMLDCMAVTLVTYPTVFASFTGWPPVVGTGRTIEVPSIEPTADGYVVFTTNSAQQFQDFLLLIGRPEWLADEGLARASQRFARRDEFLAAVHEWSRGRESKQALEEASLLRIPVGPVLNGSDIASFEQFVARGVFRRSPSGRFRQPRPPYRIGGVAERLPAPAPHVGADDGRVDWDRRRPGAGYRSGRPLEGVRILDATAWWAGPSATSALACLGANVVKVESAKRPDQMRFSSTRPPSEDGWWEWGGIFHAVNASKRGVTLDLGRPEGVELFERLAAGADMVVENYTPRVMENFGLTWERLREVNPRLVMLRMPAFGLDGPWRERTGFAQTMECISGMAWVTGRSDGPPVLPRGACDPIAGMHAALAGVLALQARARDGQGRLVEVTMIEAALNVTAEQIIAFDVEGIVLGRGDGRRDGHPRGIYPAAGDDRWIALEVTSDEQWNSLRALAGIDDPSGIAEWSSSLEAEAAVDSLLGAGIPGAVVVSGRDIAHNPQLRHRELFETEDHPVTGRHELPVMPFRLSGVDHWMTRAAPTLGQHNDEVLSEVAPTSRLDELRHTGVIGESLGSR